MRLIKGSSERVCLEETEQKKFKIGYVCNAFQLINTVGETALKHLLDLIRGK